MKIEEQRLVALAKLGDNTAFEELYFLNKEKIFNLSYQYTRNHQDAEDLLQETFSRAFLAIDSFKGSGDAGFSTWLYRIGINCAINFVKKRHRHLSRTAPSDLLPVDTMACNKANPEETASMDEMHRQLQNGLSKLSARQRMVFVLKHQQGLKTREIANHMNCSEGSVKKQLSRAVSTLMRQLSVIPVGELQ
jgi:RNA polymerase sigma-70 factor (ECF subfamily)